MCTFLQDAAAVEIEPMKDARYKCVGSHTSDIIAAISVSMLFTLMPGQGLLRTAVDLLFHVAAATLKEHTHSDVRVLPSWNWQRWLKWAGAPPGTDPRLPPTLVEGAFKAVDYLLIPWFWQNHYSTLVFINLGTPCSSPGLFHLLGSQASSPCHVQ